VLAASSPPAQGNPMAGWARIECIASLQGLPPNTAMVVEAAVGTLNAKIATLRAIEANIDSTAVIATAVTDHSIGEMATLLAHPGRLVGVRFFSPIASSSVVEVVRGPDTANATMHAVAGYLRAIDKAGVVVTVWASDRSIHILLDGAVIRTRPSRLSEYDLRDLLRRGARVAGPEPARGAVTVDMLTTSAVIEVARTVSRDGCIGLGGHKVLLESTLVGKRVTVRFEGTLMHIVANGRLVKTLPAPLPVDQRTALRGARPTSEPLPPPAPPHRAMRRVAANGTVTVAGQRLRVGRSYHGETVAIAIEDTVFRVFIDGNEICTHARNPDTDITIFKAYPRRHSI